MNILNLGIAANAKTLQEKPDLTRRFVRSTLKAYDYMREHVDETVNAVVKAVPSLKPDVVREQIRQTIPLMESAGTKQYGIGYQAKADWEQTEKVLADIGLIKQRAASVDVYFTNDLLK